MCCWEFCSKVSLLATNKKKKKKRLRLPVSYDRTLLDIGASTDPHTDQDQQNWHTLFDCHYHYATNRFFLLPASPTSVQFYYWPVLFSLIKILTRKQTAITLIGPNFAMILCTFSHYITPQHTLFIYPSWCLCVTSFPLSWFIEDFAFFFLKKTK